MIMDDQGFSKILATAIESSLDGMAILNEEREYIYLNKNYVKIFAYDRPDDLVGKSWVKLHKHESEIINEKILPAILKKGQWQGELIGVKSNGNSFPQELAISKMREGGYVCITRDITKRKQSEKALAKSEERFRTLFEKSLDGIYRSTISGKYLDVNQALVNILGYDSKEDLLSINISEKLYYNQADRPEPRERNKVFVTRLKKKDGSLIWAEITSWVVYDEQGEILYYEGIVRDITKRKQAARELYNTKEQLQITLKSIGDAVIVTDIEGKIIMVNNVAKELTGWHTKEALGKPLTEVFNIINEKTREPVKNPVEKVLASGKIEGLANHTVLISAKGKETAIADSAAPIIAEDGIMHGAVMVFRDVSKEREIMEKLQVSATRYRSLFENTGTAMMIIEENTIISLVNHQTELLSGYSKEEIETKMSWQQFIPDQKQIKELLKYNILLKNRDKLKKDAIPPKFEIKFKNRKGEIKDILLMVDTIPGKKQFIASLLDITERKKTEDRIKYIGFHDDLTGLYNRAYFEEALKRLDTKRQLPLSIIMGDVNGLKLINDAFGHQEGDKLLLTVSNILKESCRQEDIIARWGGDEFVVLLPRIDHSEAVEICERLSKNFAQAEKNLIQPSIALGFATKNKESENVNEVLKQAENWMYKRKLMESKSARSSIISSLESTLWEKNYETEEHGQRLKELAKKMGKALKLPYNIIDELVLLAGLHDIGKVAIPDSLLNKSSSLTEEEWTIIKKHPVIGYRIADSTTELAPIAEAILQHHEWWDGTGYPQGLKGEEIQLISRIIAIVDAYDIMKHERSYKAKFNHEQALEELQRCAGTQFDPFLVEVFIKMITKKEKSNV